MPLIPLFIVVYLHSNVVFVGLVTSISSMASVPALIMWGDLSDKFKKRKIFILIGFFGSFLSLLIVFMVKSIPEYVLMLVIFQLISMASVPVSTLLILENSEKSLWSKIMARFNSYSAVGTVIGLGIGVFVLFYDTGFGTSIIKYLYVIAAFAYLISGIVSLFFLKEGKTNLKRERLWYLYTVRVIERIRYFPTHILHIPERSAGYKVPRFLKNYLITALIFMIGFQMFFIPYPVFMIREFNATNADVYIMYLLNSLMSASTYIPASRYINYVGSNKMLSYSVLIRIFIFILMGIVSFFVINSILYLTLFILVYGIMGGIWSFIGLSEVTSISNMSDPVIRGRVIGLYNSFNGIGQIIGSGISGFIAFDIGYPADFFIAAIIVTSGLLIIKKTKPPDTEIISRKKTLQV